MRLQNVGQREIAAPVDGYENPYYSYLLTLKSDASRRTLATALRIISEHFWKTEPQNAPWWTLRNAQTTLIRAWLHEQFAVSTANTRLAALRGILRQCWKLQLMSFEDYHLAIADIDNFRQVRVRRTAPLSNPQITKMVNHFDSCGLIGIRNLAILNLMYVFGLRRAEVCRLKVEDYQFTQDKLIVLGKGDKERTVPMPVRHRRYLDAWLMQRGVEPGYLIPWMNKSAKIDLTRNLTPDAIYKIVTDTEQKLDLPHASPHKFRAMAITNMLRAMDSWVVARIVGHSNESQTRTYDLRPFESDLEEMKGLDITL